MTDEALGPVFKALADPTRRLLLDRLRHRNGQTLTELCGSLGMARQSATQHLDLLAQANLVTVVRQGRERLHYLNPAPIHEIGERWIAAYDAPRLATISAMNTELFGRATDYARGVLSELTYDDLRQPTPCEGWDAGRVVLHLADVIDALIGLLETGMLALPQTPRTDDPDPVFPTDERSAEHVAAPDYR